MRRLIGLIVSVAVLAATGSAFAGIATGTIRVEVFDQESGKPLRGAQISAISIESITKRKATTNAQGIALLPALDPSAKYSVSTIFTGYNGARNDNVLVKSGDTTAIRVELSLSTLTESVTITAETPIVDVTSAVSGQDITLELTESLPTGRSYQSYLQFVPGVLPDDPESQGNPASRSGLNYRDIGGDLGVSRDNFYYIEGINVTDPVTGTFGANLNTEIIQEQKVITGGIPAEYQGAAGLVSNVITKFGGNEFSGSLNYFFQSDSLVEQNENADEGDFQTYDTAFTLGGPIVRDELWFFASYRKLNREDDVTSLDTDEFLRTVENDQDQYYGKLTWQATASDRFSGTWLGDPTDIDGRRDRDILNERDRARDQGGDRYTVTYQHVFGAGVIDVAAGKHNGEVSDFSSIAASENDVIFQEDQISALADQQLGGFGEDIIDERDVEFYKASTEWFVGSSFGQHTIKGGVEFEKHENHRDRNLINDARFVSVNNDIVADCIALGTCTGFNGTVVDANFLSVGAFSQSDWDVQNTSDFNGLLDTVLGPDNMCGTGDDSVDAAAFCTAYDGVSDAIVDGVILKDDLAFGMVFDSTTGNPDGRINYSRDFQTASGPQDTKSEGLIFYLQDTLQRGRWTINAGIRAERWEHFATTGDEIFKFDWKYAPRASVIYDLKGDGRQKLSGYYGRYYDPIRNNMTNFAGTLTGRILEEQIWVDALDKFVAFRTRGGPVVQDAFFSPTTETPYTDEWELSYQVDLGRNMSLEASWIRRETRDIMEDYDLALYAFDTDGVSTDYPGPLNDPESLWLGLDYFGYDVNPGSNFVIATLEGGKRDWDGYELVFRKRYADNWQGLFSYNYATAEGNSNSDSNADFQGDVLYLDPRAPNQFGRQPGLIKHLLKFGGSYTFDFGLKLGGSYRWNEGTYSSRTELRFSRHLPIRLDAADVDYEFAGIPAGDERWLQEGSVGTVKNPSWGSMDLRAQYNHDFGKFAGEFFIDIFNVLDDQHTIRVEDREAGDGLIAFGDPIQWVTPRRFFLGARVSF